MWALKNRTAYAAERSWIRDKHGVHHWMVAIKATFSINADGTTRLFDENPPPALAPVWFGEPSTTSLKHDSDLGPAKPTTDVIIIASAYAPSDKPVLRVPVRLRFGLVEKTLIVLGDGVYQRGSRKLADSSRVPFIHKPIRYEHAWGGSDSTHPDPQKHAHDPRNPVGRGFAVHRDLDGNEAHSIEYPNGDPSKNGPAGFCAIDRPWQPRISHAGSYDDAWSNNKKPLLPDDYDSRFELCSPVDQRPNEHLRGGEAIELTNMTRSGLLRFALPQIHLTFHTRFGSKLEEHRGQIALVIVEPGESRLSIVWQSALRVAAGRVEHLDCTTISEQNSS